MIGLSGIAIRNITRASSSVCAELGKFSVSTIHEAMGRAWLMAPYMRPVLSGKRVSGTAITIFSHPGDDWMLHVAAEMLQAGEIAVLGISADNADAMFGDLLATSFKARGGVALIIDAGGRDTVELRTMGFSVWSKHRST